jgi:hypothetical protein
MNRQSVMQLSPDKTTLPDRFCFQHAELRRAGTVFVRGDDRRTLLKMDFGELKGSLPLDRLARSLDLPPDSHDHALLALVPDALSYMRQIRADDPVPGELIDGRPSWLPKPHVLDRAAATIWRAVQGLPELAQVHTPPSQHDPAQTADMQTMARRLLGLFPEMTIAQAEAHLQAVVSDLARVDWLRRAIATLQRMVGELAQFSVLHASEAVGDLGRRTALQLREVTIWGTNRALAADTAVGDIPRLLAQPDLLRHKAWPAICALRALILDVEPLLLRWQAARDRSDGGPRQRDMEDLLRLTLQRYAGFNPDRFIPIPDRPAEARDD